MLGFTKLEPGTRYQVEYKAFKNAEDHILIDILRILQGFEFNLVPRPSQAPAW